MLADRRFRPTLAELGREVGRVAAAERISLEGFNGFDPHAFSPSGSAAAIEQCFDDMVAFNRRSAKSQAAASGAISPSASAAPRSMPSLSQFCRLRAGTGSQFPCWSRLVELVHELEQGRSAMGLPMLERLAEARMA